MIAVIRLKVFLGCLVLSLGCGNATPPTAPTALAATPPVVQAPPRPAVFPPVSSAARVFDFNGPSSQQIRDYTSASRFVLQPDGTFGLQYGSLGAEYPGTYAETDRRILFTFTSDGRWSAEGTLNGDLMEVRYSDLMVHSDFENAVYRRTQ